MKDALRLLDLGNSVAEFDESLEKYFVENEAFYALINSKVDIIAGDKGTGKTALYRILQKRYRSIKELAGVEVLAGFNPAGNPVFQRLVHEKVLSEGQYASVWKAYFLSLLGNWAIEIAGEEQSDNFKRLNALLGDTGLRSKDDKPATIFSKLINAIQRLLNPKSAEVEFKLSETGVPVITPKITFHHEDLPDIERKREVPHDLALAVLDACLSELGYSVWVVMDRLDEAFQGFTDVEVPALRALFRTYLDLLGFSSFRLKLFVRRDLFRRLLGDGFVNLTHVNARKIEIRWDEEDLLNLLCRRVRDSAELIKLLQAEKMSDADLFYRLFPSKVDQAERKPTTWSWIMSRIRDGANVRPPRNLIDLVIKAREVQLRAEARTPRPFVPSEPLITADSIRSALTQLSVQRVEDTLIAEAGKEVSPLIEKFRRSKAEHDLASLREVLGLSDSNLDRAIKNLTDIGFLEELKSTWKIPMLYRDGLDITQGKAFDA